ncbi:unnamed protein product, partial [Brassica rapa]
PVCADGQPQTSCVCWRTPTDVLCVLNRQPTWAKITQTVHEKGQRAESKVQRADMCTDRQPRTSSTDVLCVLADTLGRPVCTEQTAHDQRADMCTDGQPRTSSTDVLCVLTDTHGRPVQPTWAKITRTVHGKGQRAESKDQRADIQPTWAKITRTVHGKGQRAESKDQRADMCTDGQPQTSYTRTATDVMCVLTDTHRRPVCADGHPRTSCTSCVCWRTPTDVLCVLNRQPTWTKITQTIHRKGQHAESMDQRADMCTDGQPQTSYGHTRTATHVLCVLTDTHGRPVFADGHPLTSCLDTRTATDVMCVLVDTHGRPVCTEQTAHVGQNHPNSPREGSAC